MIYIPTYKCCIQTCHLGKLYRIHRGACRRSTFNTSVPQRYLFYLESGNCVLGFDLTNTAEKLFSATLATAKPKVRLGNLAYYMEKVKKVEGRDWRRRCGTCGG